jgi:hypothetical protein
MHLTPLHTLTLYLSKTHCNITFKSRKLSLSCRPSDQTFECISHSWRECWCPVHTNLLYLIILIKSRDEYKLWSSSPCSFLSPPVTSYLLRSNRTLLLSTRVSNTLNLCSFLRRRVQATQHKRADVVYVQFYPFLYRRRWYITKDFFLLDLPFW